MPANSLKLDRIDIRILAQLQKCGRIANVDLANAVGLSPRPCLMRLRPLEKWGFVTGYGAKIDMQKIGNVRVVFTQVTLSDHRREDFDKFEAAIRDIDEIIECHMVGGGDDYLLKFVTSGVAHYQTIIEGLLEARVGIEKYFSYLVVASPFNKGHYPAEKMFSQGLSGSAIC